MDSYTRKGQGSSHKLERGISCALTDSAKHALGAHPGDWIQVHLVGGGVQLRRFDDRAPEADNRCDLYNVDGYQTGLGDHAEITLGGSPHTTPTVSKSHHH